MIYSRQIFCLYYDRIKTYKNDSIPYDSRLILPPFYSGSPTHHDEDDDIARMAGSIMHDESARSQPGFDNLQDIGDEPSVSFRTNKTNPWLYREGDYVPGPVQDPSVWARFNENVRGRPTNVAAGHARRPGDAAHNLPPPPPARAPMSDDTLAAMRVCLPNLSNLPDDVVRIMDPALLIQLNAGAQPLAQAAAPNFESAAAMAAAAAAHFATHHPPKTSDPAIKMARTLERLRQNPVAVPAGLDDRISVLHEGRFLPGTVAPCKRQWTEGRRKTGIDGTDPLATYDMASAGLGGCVTNQGWFHLANPGSSGLCLKQFSSQNIGNTAGFSRRFSLAEGEAAINIGDDLKEIADLATFTHAIRVMTYAARHVMPWNHSFPALDNFLFGLQYSPKELANSPNKIQELVNFVNHVLGVNAQNYINEENFLTAPDLTREFAVWIQSRPAAAVSAAVTDGQPKTFHQNYGFARSWQRGRGSSSNQRGGGHSGQYSTGGGGGAAGGGQGQPPQSSNRGGQFSRANSSKVICRRFNAGTCMNHYSRCFLPVTNDKAFHVCNVTNAQGYICGSYHPAYEHKPY